MIGVTADQSSQPKTQPSAPRSDGVLGVAIVGAGMIAQVHLAAARAAGARVAGVLGSSADASQQTAERWGLDRGYADLAELLDDEDVDVVHVCTPNATHHHYAVAALRAGRHVVCEKPIGVSLEEAESLVATARATGLVATVPFVYRYHPVVRELRARARRGDFGPWRLLHGSYLQDWLMDAHDTNWRVDGALGGASRTFADIGSHWFDLVEWVSGERISELTALSSVVTDRRGEAAANSAQPTSSTDPDLRFTNTPDRTGDGTGGRTAASTEDVAMVLGRTRSGVGVSFVGSQVSPGRKNRLWFECDGAAGSAAFDQELPDSAWLGTADGAHLLMRGAADTGADARRLSTLPPGHPMGYADAFAAFVADTYAVILGEVRDGLPTLDDGLRAARLTDAFLRSSAARSWVDVAGPGDEPDA